MQGFSSAVMDRFSTGYTQKCGAIRFFYVIDSISHCEKLEIGLRGGEYLYTFARGYEQRTQAEALRCTQRKRAPAGARFRCP